MIPLLPSPTNTSNFSGTFSSPTQTLVTVSDHIHSAQVSKHNLRAKVIPFPFPLFLVFSKLTATQALLFSKYTGGWGGNVAGFLGVTIHPGIDLLLLISYNIKFRCSGKREQQSASHQDVAIYYYYSVPHRQVCR